LIPLMIERVLAKLTCDIERPENIEIINWPFIQFAFKEEI